MSVEALSKAILAAIGGNDEAQEVSDWLDTGYPLLNKILSGSYDKGVPYGRIMEIYGPPSAGKTLIATMIMVAAQRAGGVAIFMDHEYTFQMPFAKRLGLNDQFPYFIYKREETWESANTVAMQACEAIRKSKAIPDNAPIVVVFDSVAAMIPKSMLFDSKGNRRGIDDYSMNDTTALARASSTTLRSINKFTADFNVSTIYLNQIRTKIGVMYGDPTTTPGGGSFEFYASIRLALGKKQIKEGAEKEVVGQLTGITTKKNKLTKPFQETELRLSFGEDGMAHFDFHTGMIEHLIKHKILPVSGAFVEWEGKKYYVKALSKKLSEEPDGLSKLKALLPKHEEPEPTFD